MPKGAGRTTAAEPVRTTLRAVIDRLRPAVLDVATAPQGLDVVVGDPVISDPTDTVDPPAGAVVLAVAVDTDAARAETVKRAGAAGASAVVVKDSGPLSPEIVTAAQDAGVAVLLAPRGLSWGQLYSLLVTAGNARPVEDTDVPTAPLGDLFALANAVAAVVGGATTIEDPHNRVLAYSNLDHPIDTARQQTILGRQVPAEWSQRLHDAGVFRRLWHTDDVIRVADFVQQDGEYLPRIAVAVRAGGELLGSIWVIEGTSPLGPDAERTLRDAADIAALHLLRHRAAVDVERHRRAEFLLALLDGTAAPELAREQLGIDGEETLAVVAFDLAPEGGATDPGGSEPGAGARMAASRLADLAAVYCESYRHWSACAATASRVYAVVSADESAEVTQPTALATAILQRAGQALRVDLRAGIGSAVGSLDLLVRSRREADEVLDVLGSAPPGSVASIGSVRSKVILHRLTQIAVRDPALTAGKVAALAEQDAVRGTAWVATLRAYFDAFGDMAAAAAAVNVHPNTFRYRLRRITEVFGLNLADPDERLVAELQLRFLEARS
jgi:hypothetical protein